MKYVKDNRTETEKMLDIIHRNHNDKKMTRDMDRQLKELDRQEKEKKSNKIMIICLGVVFVSLLIFMYNFSQKQVNSCVAAGHDRDWCIVNG